MFKLIVVGVWACLVAVGADFVAQRMAAPPVQSTDASSQKAASAFDNRKTPELNVPKIKAGVLTGYVVAKFGYQVDMTALKSAKLNPDPIVVDEALRYLYADDSTDFTNLKKVDFSTLTDKIKNDTNSRVGSKVIADVTVEEFNLLAKEQVEKPF